jgi:hypothetical protein
MTFGEPVITSKFENYYQINSKCLKLKFTPTGEMS